MNRRNLSLFLEQLELHADAGLPLDLAADAFGEVMPKHIRRRCNRVAFQMRTGKRLSKATATELRMPGVIGGILDAGEESGTLPEALRSCRRLIDREDELIKRCMSAAIYPLVIGGATVLLTIGLVEGVMPQIIPMLSGLHTELPLLTKIVICLSKFLEAHWWKIGIISIVFGFAVVFLPKKITGIRKFFHTMLLHAPLLGGLACSYSLVAFFESFGSMLEAGMPAASAFEQAACGVAFMPIKQILMRKVQPLIRGEPFSSAISDIPHMPAYARSLVRAGESSGKLGVCILRLASTVDGDLEHSLKRMTSLLEPTMMMGMGCVVGSVALSIMMPIYDISKTLQR